MALFKKNASDAQQLNGLLEKGVNLEGKLTFDGVVQINGEFRGEIYSDGTLIVGPEAHVHARIMVDEMIVQGCVEGEVEAKTKIELHAQGQLIANVIARSMVMQEGAQFQGTCQMPGLLSRGQRSSVQEQDDGERVYLDLDRETMTN